MTPLDRLRAREQAWSFCAALFRSGPDAEAAELLLGEAGPWSREAAAAATTRLLLLEVPPYESAWRSEDGLLGGEVAGAVRMAQARAGLGAAGVEPDHLARELEWMSWLAGAELDAAEDGVATGGLRALQREALDDHLLRWLPGWLTALEGVVEGEDPTPEGRAERTVLAGARRALDLALDLRRELEPPVGVGWSLPAAPPVLDDPRHGLGAVARHLCVPAFVGGWWSPHRLRAIGRALELPMGFGSRAALVEELLHSAAHYQRVPELLQRLDAELLRWSAGWASLSVRGAPAAAAPWHARVEEARRLLHRIDAARQGIG